MVVLASASVGYLQSTTTSQFGALRTELSPAANGQPVRFPSVLMSPAPSALVSPPSLELPLSGTVSVLIEQFAGQNDQPRGDPDASVYITDTTAISRLVRELNALPVFPDGIVSCGVHDGAYFALVFTYADGSTAALKVEDSGCGRVYLGGSLQPVAWILTSPEVIDTFKGLLARIPAS